jgi:hypothetical protein
MWGVPNLENIAKGSATATEVQPQLQFIHTDQAIAFAFTLV